MTAALRHALAWERTPPAIIAALFFVGAGFAVTGALQVPVAQSGDAQPREPHAALSAPVDRPAAHAADAATEPVLAAPSTPDAAASATPAAALAVADAAAVATDAAVAAAPAVDAAPVAARNAPTGVLAPHAPTDPRCPPRWSIRFRRGSWSAPPRLSVSFVKLRGFLSKNPRANVLVLGYADPLGSDRDNHALSVRRAQAVAVAIRRVGIPLTRLTVDGVGSFTAEEESSPDSDALRRVDVRVRGVTPCAGVSEEVVGP